MIKRIPDMARQGIVDRLILIGHIDGGLGSYFNFFQRVYPEAKTKKYSGNETLLSAISRHCDIFAGDWGDENGMFAEVDILNWTDEQFLFFCKEYVNPVFNRYACDENQDERINLQPKCVDAINFYLRDCGFELRQSKIIGDKVEYELYELAGVKGTIQGIVFAAVGKPDLLFTDFLNQEAIIPANVEKYLYYDQKINIDGLKWRQLREWYDSDLDCVFSGSSFVDRLQSSVNHCGSPIEKVFFDTYLEMIEEVGEDIPALLPQVYLYYDSKVQKDRLKKIFDHQCMDFLMLMSESRRVVIELDGVQHYAEDDGVLIPGKQYPVHIASVDKYASMASAQRDLTLAGYEVYRFGGKELNDEKTAKKLVKQFFKDLFAKHGINIGD